MYAYVSAHQFNVVLFFLKLFFHKEKENQHNDGNETSDGTNWFNHLRWPF